MPIVDLNDTESQSPSVIPDGVYQLEIKLRPGSAGPDGLLKVARNLRSLMLVLECIVIAEVRKSAVINSDHAKRRVWDYITVDYDESDDPDLPPIEADKLDNYKTSVRMGRARLRAILDSAYALMPNDTSDAARQKRMLDSCPQWLAFLRRSHDAQGQRWLRAAQCHRLHHHTRSAGLSEGSGDGGDAGGITQADCRR